MKILSPAHRYELENFEDKAAPGQVLQFIEKQAVKLTPEETELRTVHDGTTNEEVLLVLIDRMRGLHFKFPCQENFLVITRLEESLALLHQRTADRAKRGVEGQHKA